MSKPLFELGQIVTTPRALNQMERCRIQPATLLARHAAGDWGELCEEDVEENARALEQGGTLYSVYTAGANTIWVTTLADRSITTLKLPIDY